MTVRISVQQGDVVDTRADVLLLKYARSFHGADAAVSSRLVDSGACGLNEITPAIDVGALVRPRGGLAASAVLFVGVPPISAFRYREMQHFARRAIEHLARHGLPAAGSDGRIATTVHGVGYGLDLEEATRALVLGFQQGLAEHPLPAVRELVFVERSERRFEILRGLLADQTLVVPVASARSAAGPARAPDTEPERKKCVFVAMPFSQEFEDVYQFGIYNVVRRCGYVCERVDASVFAGDIVGRITEGIRSAEFVIADLSLERPNVYLEVGFAWGIERKVILIAREGQTLHFDVSHQKCLFYPTIGRLATMLEATIRELFRTPQPSGGV